MKATRRMVLALAALACRAEAPPAPAAPSPESEAAALVARARREVEQAVPEAKDPAGALHVPASAQGRQVPLLVFLHGLGGSGAGLASGLRLEQLSQSFGFAFLAPDGMLDYSGRRFWNASESCCNFDRIEVDHIALLREWITGALKDPRVDSGRVYLVGYSNGGFLAYRAACELGSMLRGIFSIAGAGPNDPKGCRPDKPPSVVEIHGDQDPIVSFAGGYLFADRRRPRHPSAEASLRPWQEHNGCSEAAALRRTLDLDPRIAGAETEVWSYPGCTRRVELWRIRGGDHSAGLSRHSVSAIWEAITEETAAAPAAP